MILFGGTEMRCFTFKNCLLVYLEKKLFFLLILIVFWLSFCFSEQKMEEIDSVRFKPLLEDSNVPSTYSADTINIDGWVFDLFSYCSYVI